MYQNVRDQSITRVLDSNNYTLGFHSYNHGLLYDVLLNAYSDFKNTFNS